MARFSFMRLIEKYSVNFLLILPVSDVGPVEYDDLGREIKTESEPIEQRGALIPANERIVYLLGGRVTQSDRILYTSNHNIPQKSKIIYDGLTFYVEEKIPFEQYADFSQYIVKSSDNFN